MPSNENEIFGNGNGLKDRVTACRKRLRLNRIHRAHVDNQLEEPSRETVSGASEFRGYSVDHSAVRESVFTREQGFTRETAKHRRGSMSKRLE